VENLKIQRTINSRFFEKFGTKEPPVPVISKKNQRTRGSHERTGK
jgi:hypothetical protein